MSQLGDRTPTEIRFWPKVAKGETTEDCWLWRGGRTESGYARLFRNDPKGQLRAHRVAFELMVGPIPEDLTLDHLCRVRHCVNPWHLEPVTLAVNVLRGESLNARNARKTQCHNGHPFDGINTHIDAKGHRSCRACSRGRDHLRYGYKGMVTRPIGSIKPPRVPNGS